MVGVLVALVLSQPAMPSASVTCPNEPASCDAAWIVAAADAPEGPRDYATPAEVDCEAPVAAGQELATECETSSLDFWYRVSRLPDRDAGSLVPTRHPRGSRVTPACGVPPDHGQPSAPQLQPLALFAVPTLMPIDVSADLPAETRRLPARVLAPPDRPPRV
jgi:hypothetical protein